MMKWNLLELIGDEFPIQGFSYAFGGSEESGVDQCSELIGILRQKEQLLVTYNGKSPQRHLRLGIVQWIAKIAGELNLVPKTLFDSVYLFDRFADAHDISPNQIHVVALACLCLAAKIEEVEEKVPKMTRLRSYLPKGSEYTEDLFGAIEKYILDHYEWQLTTLTVIDFLGIYLMFSIEPEDLTECPIDTNNNLSVRDTGRLLADRRSQSLPEINSQEFAKHPYLKDIPNSMAKAEITQFFTRRVREVATAVDQYLPHILLAEPSTENPPSLIAAAVLMHAREYLGYNAWSRKLCVVTDYTEKEVKECLINYVSKCHHVSEVDKVQHMVLDRSGK